jgi:hypothetical protein
MPSRAFSAPGPYHPALRSPCRWLRRSRDPAYAVRPPCSPDPARLPARPGPNGASYINPPNYSTFWGGSAPHAYWMEKDDILASLRRYGFDRLSFIEEPNPNGAALRLVAVK